jgi:hypothetical protein
LIKEKIEYFLENPDEAEMLGNNLKNEVEVRFTVDKMLAETVKVYML